VNLSGHQSARSKSDTYLTPPEWVKALGPFDLDPCCPENMPWPTATKMLTKGSKGENWRGGLAGPWAGRVWLNPPFGNEAAMWLMKLACHGNGIALIPARTETAMFYESVWPKASAVCFVRGRPHFLAAEDTTVHHAGKEIRVLRGQPFPFNSGAPIALVAYGQENVERLREANLGIVLLLTPSPPK
jgi:hypothetical protein